MSLQIYILGTLSEVECHPYDLKKKVLKSMGNTISINDGTLYYNFEVLLKKGFIEKIEVVHSENRPEKTLYAITDLGRKQLEDEIYASFQKLTDIKSLYATLIFLDKVDKNKLAYLVEEAIEKISRKLLVFNKEDLEEQLKDTPVHKLDGIKLIAEHAYESIRNDKDLLEKLLVLVRD